jgi:uncharacterized protein YqkB
VKPQLLCTFAHRKDLDLILDYIVSSYVISEQRLFVFSDENVYNDMYVTFNVETADTKRIANTILVHRKKETNTMYTVNALNVIIREANNGILDKSFIINWNAYRNSILLTSDDSLRHVRLKMFKRVDL